MSSFNTFLLVGFAAFAILSVAPVALPLIDNFVNSMEFMPRRY